jgi:hypothetical protein
MGPALAGAFPMRCSWIYFYYAQDAATHQGCPLLLHEGHESCKGAPSPRAVHFLALNVQLQSLVVPVSSPPPTVVWAMNEHEHCIPTCSLRPTAVQLGAASTRHHHMACGRGASSEMSRPGPHVCVPRPWGHLTPPGPYKRGMQARPSVPLRVVQRSHGRAKSGWMRGLEFR